MGPFVQYAAEKPADSIELRIYPGADGIFTLYEDENDNYNYEKGAYSIILFSWNEKTKTLTIGARKGKYPGMIAKRKFTIVFVEKNHGAGLEIEKQSLKEVIYTGHSVRIKE
jgi:alpha-D-xyloside xylohydrolase